MSNLLNQTESDQIVIANLLEAIKKLKGDKMTDIVFFTDKDGNVRQVTDSEQIDRTELTEQLAEAEHEVQRLNYLIDEYDRVFSPKTEVEGEQPQQPPEIVQ